jgi:segregation and condensation protein B
MEFDLKKVLQALLFSSSEPLSIKDIQAVFTRYHEQAADEAADGDDDPAPSVVDGQGVMRDLLAQVPSLLTSAQIRDAMDGIAASLAEHNAVFRLTEGPAGYRLSVAPAYGEWVRLLRGEPRPQRLRAAALETLAIIAYRQPVTRAEMEAIRGVAVDAPISRLLERELIQVTGRAELPGRPLQYGTTQAFLEFCGIRSIEELPASDVLAPNQITEWIRRASLPQEPVTDRDVGLPDELFPDESPAAASVSAPEFDDA